MLLTLCEAQTVPTQGLSGPDVDDAEVERARERIQLSHHSVGC